MKNKHYNNKISLRTSSVFSAHICVCVCEREVGVCSDWSDSIHFFQKQSITARDGDTRTHIFALMSLFVHDLYLLAIITISPTFILCCHFSFFIFVLLVCEAKHKSENGTFCGRIVYVCCVGSWLGWKNTIWYHDGAYMYASGVSYARLWSPNLLLAEINTFFLDHRKCICISCVLEWRQRWILYIESNRHSLIFVCMVFE